MIAEDHNRRQDAGEMDIVSEEQRSYNMSRIRGKDTKPELLVRSMLHRAGYRFTVNSVQNRKLPGKPDLILPKYRTVIFVHGCFWHGHEGCQYFRLPKTRAAWWKEKIEGNRERDRRNLLALSSIGWQVIVVWECTLKNFKNRERRGKLPQVFHELAEQASAATPRSP